MEGHDLLDRAKAMWDMRNYLGEWQFPFELVPVGGVSLGILEGEERGEAADLTFSIIHGRFRSGTGSGESRNISRP